MKALQVLRLKAGFTQEQVAKSLGVGQSTVSMWESSGVFPRPEKWPLLAALYGCTIDEMFADIPNTSSISDQEAG